MKEIWKTYKDSRKFSHGQLYGHLWEVSNYGNVKRDGQLVDFSKQKRYYQVGHFYVHRAVAELFIPNPKNKPCVDHIDTNIHNNNVNNLRWTTYSENLLNPITQKRKSKERTGEKNPVYGRKWMSNGINKIYPKPEEFQLYLDSGYHFGRLKKYITN